MKSYLLLLRERFEFANKKYDETPYLPFFVNIPTCLFEPCRSSDRSRGLDIYQITQVTRVENLNQTRHVMFRNLNHTCHAKGS